MATRRGEEKRRRTPLPALATGLGLAVALTLGASSGTAAREAASPPQTVRSADGGLVVKVPRGALRKPVKVRIRTLKRAQYPAEFRDAVFRAGSNLYSLEPSGSNTKSPQ